MKKNAVISLTDSAELMLTLKIYSGLKHAYRNAKWSLVTWSEYRDIVHLFGHVDQTYFIDREVVKRIFKSQVFPHSYALNSIWDELADFIKTEHHWVITVSNNPVSGYLSSIINKEHQSGLYFNQQGNVCFDDTWSRYTNEVFTMDTQSFNRYDLLRFMCGLQNENIPLLNIDEVQKKIMHNLFAEIREKNNVNKADKKLIGIDLSAFAMEKTDLTEIVFTLLASKEYFPVMLVKNGQADHNLCVNKISAAIENKVTPVEYSWNVALPMLMNLDAIITKGGLLKQLAHLSETPTLAVKTNLISNTGYSYCNNDLVLEADINQIGSDALLSTLDMLTQGKIRKGSSLPKENLYQVIKDEWGTFLLQVNAMDGNFKNISSYIMRIFMLEAESGKNIDVAKAWVLGLFEKNEIADVVQTENAKIDQSISTVLSMIRGMGEFHLGDAYTKKFFLNLDVLINNTSIHGLSGMIRALSRPPILSVGASGNEGLRELETLLLELKNNLSAAQQLLRRITKALIHPNAEHLLGTNPQEEF